MTEKQYLKMADVFTGCVIVRFSTELRDGCGFICDAEDDDQAKYISHAINSHDELVAEVERLRELLEAAKAVVTRWNTPNCKDTESTAAAIGRLMAIISKCSCSA